MEALKGHSNWAISVIFDTDTNLIISSSWDKTIIVWQLHKNGANQSLDGANQRLDGANRSLDGANQSLDGVNQSLNSWKAAIRHRLEGHTEWVWGISLSPGDSHLVSASSDRTMRVWDVGTGQQVGLIEGHTKDVESAVWSPDGKYIVSGSHDKSVRLWSVEPV